MVALISNSTISLYSFADNFDYKWASQHFYCSTSKESALNYMYDSIIYILFGPYFRLHMIPHLYFIDVVNANKMSSCPRVSDVQRTDTFSFHQDFWWSLTLHGKPPESPFSGQF